MTRTTIAPTVDPHRAVVAPLRALRARLAADEARARADAERCHGDPTPLLAELRAKYAAQCDALTGAALLDLRQRQDRLAQMLPGRSDGAAVRYVESLRRVGGHPAPDAAELGRTAVTELLATAEMTSDPVTLDAIRRELAFRAESNADLAGPAAQVARRLDALVAARADVQKWAAEHDELSIAIRNAELTRRAIETGGADEGVTEDLHRALSRRIAAGQIDKDDARAELDAHARATAAAQ